MASAREPIDAQSYSPSRSSDPNLEDSRRESVGSCEAGDRNGSPIRRRYNDGEVLRRQPRLSSTGHRTLSSHEHGETWIDFLRAGHSGGERSVIRAAEGGLSDRRDFMERKRRMTSQAEGSGRRRSSNGPVQILPAHQRTDHLPQRTTSDNVIGIHRASVSNIIDLTSPERPIPRTSGSGRIGDRRSREIVLPPWQPDSEVARCPICGTHFNFWFRKHHCRKCGRVVCANCSPHRITIPRQFIVHQPTTSTEQRVTVNPRLGQTIIDLTQETDIEATATAVPSQQSEERSAEDTSNHDPALGGGSEVRICNPCVPDPNYGPPPQPPPYDFNAGIIPDYRTADEVSNPSSTPATRHLAYYRERDTMPQERHRESTDISTHHGLNVANVSRSERQANGQLTVNGSHEIDTGLPRGPDALTNIHGRYPYHYRAEGQENIKSRESIESHTDDGGGQNSITSSSTASLVPPRSSSMYGASAGPSSSLPSQSHLGQVPPQVRHRHHASQGIARFGFRSMLDVETPIPPPKRQPIREEDLCPICHATLPPKGTEGDETAREQHVQACIETHFSTSAPRSIQPHPNTATAAAVAATSTTQAQAGGLLSSSPTLPGPRGGRMLVYNATEKDCVSDDGEEPECVICLVEFAVGDDMARLECLCKFHKTCIRQWWETKGAGACPVHQG